MSAGNANIEPVGLTIRNTPMASAVSNRPRLLKFCIG